jgi:beta-lactamase superfamily II metal-dependent hydrolase
MIFTLEALRAAEGDCLLLHYGDKTKPQRVLIDGGPQGVYEDALRDRLAELGAPTLELVVVSHIDADHITGVLALFDECDQAQQNGTPPPADPQLLWHNAFGAIVEPAAGPDPAALGGAAAPAARVAQAVAASVNQGRQLNDTAKSINVPINDDNDGLIQTADPEPAPVDLGAGLNFKVIHPDRRRLDALQKLFAKTPVADTNAAALAAAFTDNSVPNLSSIVILAEAGGKTMLLTGDARGDDILAGLEHAKLLDAKGEIELDILKVPHHGSDRNVETDFFRRVRAKHYVMSGNGKHGNPENATLQMLHEARGNKGYKVHLTYESGPEGLGPRLKAFLKATPLPVEFRDDNALSLTVDLLDPLPQP